MTRKLVDAMSEAEVIEAHRHVFPLTAAAGVPVEIARAMLLAEARKQHRAELRARRRAKEEAKREAAARAFAEENPDLMAQWKRWDAAAGTPHPWQTNSLLRSRWQEHEARGAWQAQSAWRQATRALYFEERGGDDLLPDWMKPKTSAGAKPRKPRQRTAARKMAEDSAHPAGGNALLMRYFGTAPRRAQSAVIELLALAFGAAPAWATLTDAPKARKQRADRGKKRGPRKRVSGEPESQ